MSSLFDAVTFGDLELPNRIVMAPLTRNRAPGATPTPRMTTYYAQRASAGLIVTEGTTISPTAQGYADVPGLWSAEQIAGWRAVTDAVHAAGGRIVVQLWHVGRVSHVALQPGGQAPVAPSAIAARTKTFVIRDGVGAFVDTSMPRALDAGEIPAIVEDYRHAAHCAIAAGFDGVEVHGANGYLLDQFLRDGANRRTDAWGGPIANRARLLLEVMRVVAREIGGARTGLRLSPVTPANDLVDSDPQPLFEYVVRHLGPMGLAYLHLIEGATGGPRELPDRPFDYDALRAAWRGAGGDGAWMVNNGYDAALAARALEHGADLIAFGKPFISNPDLVRRLREGLPLAPWDRRTFYGGAAEGYTDYPALP